MRSGWVGAAERAPGRVVGLLRLQDGKVRQGAVGQVRLTEHDGRPAVEKRFAAHDRLETEVAALRYLAGQELPVPELLSVGTESVVMTLMPGERLDSSDADLRLTRLHASARWLRQLHARPGPSDLPPAPDDVLIIDRYREAGGPVLPLIIPPAVDPVLCHGDWTDGNVLAEGSEITAILDWEAAHVGDPIRELSRAAWGASLKDARSVDALVEGYDADPASVRAWFPIHAAELWLWFAEAGPPEYLEQLTETLRRWPGA
jgi:aminoglycoside phosphotransferase (APT) family kinase protein